MPHSSYVTACDLIDGLRARRRSLGLSIRETARRAESTPGTVCHWERGDWQPTLPSLVRWASALGLAVTLAGCALFSTPGRVTSQEGTSDAGGVYLHVVQPANGIGCPSAIAFGAQTMGGIDATCTDGGRTQTIHATTPDPNPALTAAYAGINAQAQIFADLAKQIIAAGLSAAAGPLAPVVKPLASRALASPPVIVAPNQLCPPGTLPVTISGGSTVCQ